MKRKGIAIFAVTLIPALIIIVIAANISAPGGKASEGRVPSGTMSNGLPRLIAHAGGDIYGIRLTNSLQALDSSYDKQFRYFELDIERTSDGIPVFVHDWGNANWFMNVKNSTKPPTYAEFKSRKAILGLSLMDLEMLEKWLENHKDAFIITDIKKDNVELLSLIKEKYPRICSNIIPQIYSFDEYDRVRDLGYENIILTLYRLKSTESEILDFCRSNRLLAVTLYQEGITKALVDKFAKLQLPVYAHTVNHYNEYVKLRDMGVYGVYTDCFAPATWVE